MARIVSHIVRALAWLIVTAIVVQFYFAGAFVFGVLTVEYHRALGMLLFLTSLLTALLALTTRGTRANWKRHFSVVGIMLAQGLLVFLRPVFPAIAAIHAANAVVVLLVAHRAARRAVVAPPVAMRVARPSLEVQVA